MTLRKSEDTGGWKRKRLTASSVEFASEVVVDPSFDYGMNEWTSEIYIHPQVKCDWHWAEFRESHGCVTTYFYTEFHENRASGSAAGRREQTGGHFFHIRRFLWFRSECQRLKEVKKNKDKKELEKRDKRREKINDGIKE
jgi:hypothetical protein